MSEKKSTYLETLLEASITRDKKQGYTFVFQTEKIKLDHAIEIEMLKDIEPSFQKEIVMNEDELKIMIHPPEDFQPLSRLQQKQERYKWMFAHQLIKKVQNHSFTRLHVAVCPENIMFDKSLTPAFLHYGVKESIPPYERDDNREFAETKATIASVVEPKYTFEQYLKLHETLQLSEVAASILKSANVEELLKVVRSNIEKLEQYHKTLIQVPKKRWTIFRFASIGMFVLLIPAIIYTFYSSFFLQPKQEAFVNSNEAFLQQEYSKVVEELESYDVDDMPKVVQYELALSYLTNESLGDKQKETIQNMVTLQSDPKYLTYWIHIGRGENEQALENARSLEDRSLIMYGLYKYKEELKADDGLSSDERKEKLDPIQSEIEEYESQLEEEKKQTEQQAQEQERAEEKAKKKQEEEQKKAEEQKKQNEANQNEEVSPTP
ncbi:type VII secretion protein EssB [Priestia megaterium]|nr:type VII secretion protein EssB [Priestia megaterium]